MTSKIIRTATLALAAALLAAPAISQATTTQATTPVHTTYETSLQSVYGLPSPWTGTLQLTFNPSGIIQGYYHPADNYVAFVPVTGARNGNQVWLDIGRAGRLHVNGVINDNGVITGGAFDETTLKQYKFSAKVSS